MFDNIGVIYVFCSWVIRFSYINYYIRDLCYVWIVYIYKRYFKIYGIIYELYYYSVEF